MNTYIDPRIYNVRSIAGLEEMTLDEISQSKLKQSYALLSYNLVNDRRYISYKIRLNSLTEYIYGLFSNFLTDLDTKFIYYRDHSDVKDKGNNYFDIIRETKYEPLHTEGDNLLVSYTWNVDPIISYTYIPELTNSYITTNYDSDPMSYVFALHLSHGLVTDTTLKNYVENTLERIMGVPSTPEALDEAINSIQEFVDWFKGYMRNDEDAGTLQKLIDKIEAGYDNLHSYVVENRELAYAYASSLRDLSYSYALSMKELSYEYSNHIKLLAYDYTEKYIREYCQNCPCHGGGGGGGDIMYQAGRFIKIENDVVSSYIHITTTSENDGLMNSLTINGTKYTLELTEGGEFKGSLGFSQYTDISISSTSGGGTLEIDATASAAQLTFKVTANKNISTAPSTATWNGSETSTESGNTSQIVVSQNGNAKIQRKCIVSDGITEATSPDITLQFTKKKWFLGWSTNPNLTFNTSSSGTNIVGTSDYNEFDTDYTKAGICDGTAHQCKEGNTPVDGWWYMITPEAVNISQIYFGSGNSLAPSQGGWHQHVLNWEPGSTNTNYVRVNQYSTGNTVNYYVYRSNNSFSVPMNVQFK